MLRAWLDALDEDEEGPEEANAETEQAADPSEPTIPPILDAAKEPAAAADDDDPAALGPEWDAVRDADAARRQSGDGASGEHAAAEGSSSAVAAAPRGFAAARFGVDPWLPRVYFREAAAADAGEEEEDLLCRDESSRAFRSAPSSSSGSSSLLPAPSPSVRRPLRFRDALLHSSAVELVARSFILRPGGPPSSSPIQMRAGSSDSDASAKSRVQTQTNPLPASFSAVLARTLAGGSATAEVVAEAVRAAGAAVAARRGAPPGRAQLADAELADALADAVGRVKRKAEAEASDAERKRLERALLLEERSRKNTLGASEASEASEASDDVSLALAAHRASRRALTLSLTKLAPATLAADLDATATRRA